MKQTLLNLFAIIFPERSDARIVRRLTEKELLAKIKLRSIEETQTLLPFSSPAVRACIHEAKFHKNEKAFALLGAVLAQHLSLEDAVIAIPIPLSRVREKDRGYNQVAKILHAAKRHTRIHIYEDILFKHTDTPAQTSLGRKARLKNVQHVYAVHDIQRNRDCICDKHILLVDDVTTTGATLEAAKAALLPLHPASITCLALAH